MSRSGLLIHDNLMSRGRPRGGQRWCRSRSQGVRREHLLSEAVTIAHLHQLLQVILGLLLFRRRAPQSNDARQRGSDEGGEASEEDGLPVARVWESSVSAHLAIRREKRVLTFNSSRKCNDHKQEVRQLHETVQTSSVALVDDDTPMVRHAGHVNAVAKLEQQVAKEGEDLDWDIC